MSVEFRRVTLQRGIMVDKNAAYPKALENHDLTHGQHAKKG